MLWKLDPLSSLADVLDTLEDGQFWTVSELCAETGRTRQSISHLVTGALRTRGLTDQRIRPGSARGELQIRITPKGRRWAWASREGMPPRDLDYAIGLLELLESVGPIASTSLYRSRGWPEHKSRRVLRFFGSQGFAAIKPINRLTTSVEITDRGSEVLGSWRRLPDAAIRL